MVMKTTDINDPIFLQAVNALDAGRRDELQQLIHQHPYLVRDKLPTPNHQGYFANPYLLWFVADNPIRNEKLPPNVVEILGTLIDAVKQHAPDTFSRQMDYTLGLVATGRIPRESGFQIAMMDTLINAGAKPGNAIAAIAHGNIEAANYLIDRGGTLTLTTALLLDRAADIDQLFNAASDDEKLTALTAAAFYGKADKVQYLLDKGTNPNGYPPASSGFHSHATPLHQAVSSASLNVVKLLVEAGAALNDKDKIHEGTPLDWAIYIHHNETDQNRKAAYAEIVDYLQDKPLVN